MGRDRQEHGLRVAHAVRDRRSPEIGFGLVAHDRLLDGVKVDAVPARKLFLVRCFQY